VDLNYKFARVEQLWKKGGSVNCLRIVETKACVSFRKPRNGVEGVPIGPARVAECWCEDVWSYVNQDVGNVLGEPV